MSLWWTRDLMNQDMFKFRLCIGRLINNIYIVGLSHPDLNQEQRYFLELFIENKYKDFPYDLPEDPRIIEKMIRKDLNNFIIKARKFNLSVHQ